MHFKRMSKTFMFCQSRLTRWLPVWKRTWSFNSKACGAVIESFMQVYNFLTHCTEWVSFSVDLWQCLTRGDQPMLKTGNSLLHSCGFVTVCRPDSICFLVTILLSWRTHGCHIDWILYKKKQTRKFPIHSNMWWGFIFSSAQRTEAGRLASTVAVNWRQWGTLQCLSDTQYRQVSKESDARLQRHSSEKTLIYPTLLRIQDPFTQYWRCLCVVWRILAL